MNNTDVKTSGVTGTINPPAREADSDTILVEQYLNGDTHAFELLFKKYQAPVFNIVNRMVNGEEAYDITQDIFCSVLRALPSFRGEARFSTWLYCIAKNACLNRIRHKGRSKEDSLEAIIEEHPQSEFADENTDVEETVEMHELQQLVNKVLETLPPDQRMIITLRDFEQLSYEEIATVTGMSIPTVKSRLHRARQAFKIKFKPYIALYGDICG